MQTKTWPALLVAVAVLATAVVIVGVGVGDVDATNASGSSTDAAFIADMTVHHRGAIDMAELAKNTGEHAMGMHDGGHVEMTGHGPHHHMGDHMDDMGTGG